MRINVADRIKLGNQPVSRMYLGSSLIWTAEPAVDFVFDGRLLDSRISFARPSTATLFDASGTLLSAAINAPRYDHNPVTLAARGLLVEEQRTNYDKNSENVGFSSGKFAYQGSLNTAYFEQSFFTERGRKVRRLRFVNPQTQVLNYPQIFQGSSGIPNGQYTASLWHRFVEITANTPNYTTYANKYRPSPAIFTEQLNAIQVSNLESVTQNYFSGFEMLIFRDGSVSSPAFSTTMESSCRQYELGSYATSYIPTTGSIRTRAADAVTVNPQNWLSAEKGVFILQHDVPAGRPLLGNGNTALLTSLGPGKTALHYDASGAFVVHNGGLPQAVSFPAFSSSLQLLGAGAARANAAIARMMYYPRRLTVQQLQEATI